MRRFEKILIGLVLLLFGMQLFPNFTGKSGLFALVTWFLALSYLIGGYWLLNPKDNKRYLIPIIAGLAFATSLFVLPFTIRIRKERIFEILPILNAGLFLAVSVYLIMKRKSKEIVNLQKGIFIRSAVIMVVVCFFSYSPASFKPYRYILLALNNGNDYLVANIHMFNYTEEFEDALENEDYRQALNNYLMADNALKACDFNSEYWEMEKAYSLNQIALCYKKCYNYEYADSLFAEAIKKYRSVKDTTDKNVAAFYSNLAGSLAEQLQFGYSNLLYKASIIILQRDTNNEENKKDIIQNYNGLITNHLQADSLEQAMFFIDETFKEVDKSTVDFCNTNLYYGLCFYKLSKYKRADEILTECLDCYKKILEPANQNIAENHLALAHVKIALAEYKLAKDNLDKGIEITINNYGKESIRYANYLRSYALIDKETGYYKKAEQEYYQVLEMYINELGERNRKLPAVLSGLADLEVILAKFKRAIAHSDSSMSIWEDIIINENPSVTDLINSAAYVNYCVQFYDIADSLYHKTIKINLNFGLQFTAQTAIALNGLGLVATAKGKYNLADSLFLQALKLHKEIFTENHPFTAIVCLNYANLKIEENKLKEAKELLYKSLNTNMNFFEKEHDIFADIYVAYGDLTKKEKQSVNARDYYQRALDALVS